MNSPTATDCPDLRIRPACLHDLQAIVTIEHASFPSPWSVRMLRQEVLSETGMYLAAELDGELVGYVGMWMAADEGHIGTLAVAEGLRCRGLGEALMLSSLRRAADAGLVRVVLEYRVTNQAAAHLYAKLGFRQTRVRRRYYRDTDEDGIEVVLDGLETRAGQDQLAALCSDWEIRHGRGFPGDE